MDGAASSSMPPARSCDSISGSPPSWLLGKTVMLSRPDEREPMSLAASARRMLRGWVSGVLTPSLKLNSAAACARPPRTAAAAKADAAPSRPRRVMFVDFIIVFLPSAHRARGHFRQKRPSRQVFRRNHSFLTMKPFHQPHETSLKQSGRTHLGQRRAPRRLQGTPGGSDESLLSLR